MANIRTLLTGLLERLDASQLDEDDLFTLSMISMAVNSQKSSKTTQTDDSEALRCLALGWFVNSMMQPGPKQDKIENEV